jgi:hypothetical protein
MPQVDCHCLCQLDVHIYYRAFCYAAFSLVSLYLSLFLFYFLAPSNGNKIVFSFVNLPSRGNTPGILLNNKDFKIYKGGFRKPSTRSIMHMLKKYIYIYMYYCTNKIINAYLASVNLKPLAKLPFRDLPKCAYTKVPFGKIMWFFSTFFCNSIIF